MLLFWQERCLIFQEGAARTGVLPISKSLTTITLSVAIIRYHFTMRKFLNFFIFHMMVIMS